MTRLYTYYFRAQPSELPDYMLEGAAELTHNLQNLAMVYPNAMINFSTEPLVVNVKKAEERLDLKSGTKLPVSKMYKVHIENTGTILVF